MKSFLTIFFISITPCFAQNLTVKHFSFNEGLNAVNISKTIEDRFGFIWIATQDGVYRFDGNHFDIIKRTTVNNSICENFIFDICYDNQDYLYVNSFNGGIDKINIKNLKVEHVLCQKNKLYNALPNKRLVKICLDYQKKLWVMANDFVCRFDEATGLIDYPLDKPEFPNTKKYSFIEPFADSLIFIGECTKGVQVYNYKINKITCVIGGAAYNPTTTNIAATFNKDTVYISNGTMIHKGIYKNSKWQELLCLQLPRSKNGIINTITYKNGNLWVGCSNSLYELNTTANTWVNVPMQYKVNNSNVCSVKTIQLNKEGDDIWIGTDKDLLLLQTNEKRFTAFTGEENDNIPLNHVFYLAPKNENEIFVTAIDGLFITNIKTKKNTRIPGSESIGSVDLVYPLGNANYIVFCNTGAYLYNEISNVISKKLLLEKYPEWASFSHSYFNAYFNYNNKVYFASETDEGLIIWDKIEKQITQFNKGKGAHLLIENHIHNLKIDKKGFLWILSDLSVCKYNMVADRVVEKIVNTNDGKNFNSNIYFDMFDDGVNLWFATYNGGIDIFNQQTKQWQYITEKEGLSNNSVYCLLPENDSILWASTNNGLSSINIKTKKCTNYYKEDGLHDNSFEEESGFSWNGHLYFGGLNGFTQIASNNPDKSENSNQLLIKKIEYYYNNNKSENNEINLQQIELPANTMLVNIYLSYPFFKHGHPIKRYYKIKELQNVFLPIDELNVIQLNGLSNGNYHISFAYVDNDGFQRLSPLQLELKIRLYWYQTLFFKIAVGLAIAILLYILYSFRIKQLKKVMSIRQKIATDLHDDIGGTLSGIRILTNLAIEQNPKDYLKQIKDGITDATSAVRDTIWIMDRTRNNAVQLVEKIKLFVLPLANASNIIVDIQVEEGLENVQLGPDERRDLYLIAKEFTNNSLKHSGCKKIIFQIVKYSKKINLTMLDDGNGFDLNSVQRGNGINNICNRAENIGYQATFSSSVGGGTILQVIPKNKSFLDGLYQNRHLLRFGKTCKDLFTKKLVRKN